MNAIITKIEINARDKFEFLFNDQHPANHLDRNTTTTMNKCIMKETNNKRKDGRNGEKEKKKSRKFSRKNSFSIVSGNEDGLPQQPSINNVKEMGETPSAAPSPHFCWKETYSIAHDYFWLLESAVWWNHFIVCSEIKCSQKKY